jgi:heat-inducible transcriptional repressor
MLDDKAQEVQDMKAKLEEKADKIDTLLKRVAKLLAVNTNYATLVSGPRYQSKKVKFIQLTAVDEESMLVVIVLDNNDVKNQMLHIKEPMDQETVLKLNFILNTTLNGLDVMDMNLAVIQKIKEEMGAHSSVIDSVLELIGSALTENEDLEIYTSGATNILKYPELADKSNAAQLLSVFEEKEALNEWIEQEPTTQVDDNHAIQVYIGGETKVESMKDCSLVTATYRMDEGVYGKIGIVGPKRMDYDKVVATLQSMMAQLDDIFKDKK